ncbi:MAG: dinitrogenase iron-molybdenum cofactor biosynthesis protein [Lachnospiraceae bacterium]|nr:dinitrogenase iron-molybdenum cofactor biosynthesis protein [Lachnospiraceae bacterium]
MKVAITYENGLLFPHFGRTPAFKLYDVENGTVTESRVVETGETGHGALVGMLQELGAEVLICGGIGGGAIAAMNETDIKVYAGAAGDADELIQDYINGTLPENGDATCDHHDHEHEGHTDHDCGHGGCHH